MTHPEQIETTVVIIKSGAVRRNDDMNIVNAILTGVFNPSQSSEIPVDSPSNTEFSDIGAGLSITHLHKKTLPIEIAQKFYEEHAGKPYFDRLIKSVTEHPVLLMKVAGVNAVSRFRQILGATNPEIARSETETPTIRRFYGVELPDNAAHGSDSVESAAREAQILWPEGI